MHPKLEMFPGTPPPLADEAAGPGALGWLTKLEAAALAKVTVKTIERWAAAKRIRQGSRPSTKTKGLRLAVYWGPSVARQAARTAERGPAGLHVPALEPDPPGAALSPAAGGLPAGVGPVLDPVALGMALLTAFRQVSPTSPTSETPPAFVDVAGFARLAGLPAADITRAIAAGELPIRRTARGGIRLWAADVDRLRPKAPK